MTTTQLLALGLAAALLLPGIAWSVHVGRVHRAADSAAEDLADHDTHAKEHHS